MDHHRTSYYADEEQRLPVGLRVVFYDAERGIHQYRDADGQLWESEAGNTYGVLHRIADDTPVYFRSARHLQALSPSPLRVAHVANPLVHFPDTWDPPADHEVEDLPSAKRLAAKLGNYRHKMFGGMSRSSSGASQDSNTSIKGRSSSAAGSVKSTDSFRSTTTASSFYSVPSPAASKSRRF